MKNFEGLKQVPRFRKIGQELRLHSGQARGTLPDPRAVSATESGQAGFDDCGHQKDENEVGGGTAGGVIFLNVRHGSSQELKWEGTGFPHGARLYTRLKSNCHGFLADPGGVFGGGGNKMHSFMTNDQKTPMLFFHLLLGLSILVGGKLPCSGQMAAAKRKIIIDQDAAGPAGTDQQSILLLIQSPQSEVLGVTVVTGDAWLKEEVAHTLRMLELVGRTDIPVVAGAELPLVRRKEETELWEKQYGIVPWLGAWTPRLYHPADQLGEMPEGKPATKPSDEDAAHFLVRMVRKYPHEITIYAGGPMTNLALAITIDPEFAGLAKELVFMGASLNPKTDDPEFVNTPRHEFNLWFDPEAAHIVLMAPWKKIVCTTVDISVKTRWTQDLIDQIKKGQPPAAQYVGKYARQPGPYTYLWDELAALTWVDPSLITAKETRYLDVDLNRGAEYGDTLSWAEPDKPHIVGPPVEIQDDVDLQKFYKEFVDLLSAATPKAQ